jgi:hypothetical protein
MAGRREIPAAFTRVARTFQAAASDNDEGGEEGKRRAGCGVVGFAPQSPGGGDARSGPKPFCFSERCPKVEETTVIWTSIEHSAVNLES